MRPIRPGKNQDNKLDQHFRDSLRNMEVSPPPPMWDRLESELETERARIKYDHWYYVLLAVLIPFTALNLYLNYDLKDYYRAFLNEKERAITYGPAYFISSPHPAQVKFLANKDKATVAQALDVPYVENLTDQQVTITGTHGTLLPIYIRPLTEQFALQKANQGTTPKFFASTETGLKDILSLPEAEGLLVPDKLAFNEIELDKIDGKQVEILPPYNRKFYHGAISPHYRMKLPEVKGLYIGINTSVFQNRLFFNEEAFYPLIGKDAKFSFKWGYNYGVTVGYNFSRHFGIQAEWTVNSTQGMTYSENLYGKIPINGNIMLRYMQMPIMAKYKLSKVSTFTGYPVSLNLVGGVLYSRLTQSEIQINESRLTNTSDLFAKNELGLLAGIEYDMYFNRNFFATVGARSSVTTDVRTLVGNNSNPSYNLVLGVHAGIHYQFAGRDKNELPPIQH
ncbi:MAG: outer membrane beta-barrel protein [Chitinophagales bacterium]|nr:outer membrane beta-barrel protein [Chitinophagales bacterium]